MPLELNRGPKPLELTRGAEHKPTSYKIIKQGDIERIREGLTGTIIVFASGSFDIFHPDHVLHLEQAKAQGDVLFVGVSSDELIKRRKGKSKPFQTQQSRATVIASMECVDYVVLMPDAPDAETLELIRPTYWARGLDHTWDDIDPQTRGVITDNGIPVIRIGGTNHHSSEIVIRIKNG